MRTTLGPGMPLRGDRILRYVNAFCPACHQADPERPLAEVPRLSGRLAERDGWKCHYCGVALLTPEQIRFHATRQEVVERTIDRDIFGAAPADIRQTRVLETWLGGRKVWERK